MQFFDFHCDTLMRLYDLESQGKFKETLWRNQGHLDLERLLKSHYTAQCFACFLWLEGKPVKENLYLDALSMADLFYKEVEIHKDTVAFAGSYAEYMTNKREGKLSGFLTIEEGDILENKLERLNELYEKGIRIITLTWNFENCLGYPNHRYEFQHQGLKPFGIDALERMDELGIIADVSHLSDGGFEDVCRYGKRPFIATHSNARAIQYHNRNLTDDMIRKLAERGGVMGLNFCGDFLQDNGKSTTLSMVAHIRHIIDVGGLDVMVIGTDFDGVEEQLEIDGCQEMNKLVIEMEKAHFTTGEIEAVCYKNAEQFLKRYEEN
ncbi:MAG: dipeptidase [Lachnospiraceae bacterium]